MLICLCVRVCLFGAARNSDPTVMQWGYHGFPALIQSFNYSRGSLIIPKDGLYYLFSKVTFTNNCSMFKHEVKLNSSRYSDQLIILMMDSRYRHLLCMCVTSLPDCNRNRQICHAVRFSQNPPRSLRSLPVHLKKVG